MADIAVSELIHYNNVSAETSLVQVPAFIVLTVRTKKLCTGDLKNSISFNIIEFVDLFGLKLSL